MTNGNEAKHRREQQQKDKKKEPTSQLKANEKSMNIVCSICRQPFFVTTKEPQLIEHAEGKHKKTLKDCFPNFQA